jgi:hypothetical protein
MEGGESAVLHGIVRLDKTVQIMPCYRLTGMPDHVA